jgi:2-methylisocitrate lyase-like PEP mutase family enzyme
MDPNTLRARLEAPEVLVLPGVHDPLSALVLTQMGAEAAYVGGAAFSYGQLAAPDLNLASPDAMAEHVRRVRDATALPLVVDADTGFGDVLNVERTVRQYVQAGATGVQLEDQTHPKRCGHLAGRTLASDDEMARRLLAARRVQQQHDFLLVARTDARTTHGLDESIRRAILLERLGADLVFVESLESVEEYEAVRRALDAPLLANMVEGGRSPDLSAAELGDLGYNAVIFPGSLTRAYAATAAEVYTALLRDGSTRAVRHMQMPFAELQTGLGLAGLLAHVDDVAHEAQRYADSSSTSPTTGP